MSPSTAVVMLSPVVHPSGLANGPPAAETSGVKVLVGPHVVAALIDDPCVDEGVDEPRGGGADRARHAGEATGCASCPSARSKRVTTRPSTFTAPLPSLYSVPQTTLSPLIVGEMADAPDRQELLSALTTEHFTLQGARAQTASESASRASLYILSVSSTLVALGFIGQGSTTGETFEVFALTVLPTLYVLGVFSFIRVVECGAEDFRYGVAINRIRGYYKQIAGDQAELFLQVTTTPAGCSPTRRCRPRAGSSTSPSRRWSP